ncbi:hypothetical protein LEP1GSC170_0052, partial [Leptospira interrogans serovar Bataviae str. HAI135]
SKCFRFRKGRIFIDDDSNFATSPIDLQIASRKNWRTIFLFLKLVRR